MLMRGGTKRDETRPTDGAIVARTAEMLGKPLLPWQRYVADVAGEIDPATGTYYYDRVVLSTPRQCGKSTPIDTEDTRNACSAQTGRSITSRRPARTPRSISRTSCSSSQNQGSRRSPSPRLSNGGMEQRFRNGSFICPLAVTKVAGHGTQMDKFTIDEAFSLDDETGNRSSTAWHRP